jgi:DNA transformation protein
MAREPELVQRVLGLLLALGPVHARRMFGGYGLFLDGTMFALIDRNRLYIKADDRTKADFAAAGAEPFTYRRQGKRIALSYWLAPEGSLASPGSLLPWARLGVEAATRGRAAKARKKPRRSFG